MMVLGRQENLVPRKIICSVHKVNFLWFRARTFCSACTLLKIFVKGTVQRDGSG
jgi:hypothetical protein